MKMYKMQGNISSIDYLKLVKHFPESIENKKLSARNDNYNLNNINLDKVNYNYSYKSNNIILYNFEDKVFILDHKFNFVQELYASEIDEIKNFGYSSFLIENNPDYDLVVTGFNKNNNIFLYFYQHKNEKFELVNKVLIDSLFGNFYAKYVDDKIYIVQQDDNEINIFSFDFSNEIVKCGDTLKFDVKTPNVSLSITDNHVFIYTDVIYVIELKTNKMISTLDFKLELIESFKVSNNYLTFISDNNQVVIYDNQLNLRQVIDEKNISDIILEKSYLVLSNSVENQIFIYGLDQNGLYQQFGYLDKVNKLNKVILGNQKIYFNSEEDDKSIVNYYSVLPKRLFNQELFSGFGFYSKIDSSKGKYILLNNGQLSTFKTEDSLLIGYTNNLSDLVFENTKLEIKYDFYDKQLPSDLQSNFVIISESLDFSNNYLDKNSNNFLFIENVIIDLYLESNKGSSMEIKNENKIISWPQDGIVKITLVTNSQVVEIKTKNDIKILGFTSKMYSNLFDYDLKVISNEGNVTVSDHLLKNYQTFFPYLRNGEKPSIEALVTNKIEDFEIDFNITPLNVNLPNYNCICELNHNDLNQRFFEKYLIENNDKSIIVTDLLSNQKVFDYKVQSISGIKKIIYHDPILIVLSKPNNDIDTHIHLINSKDNKIIPYVISNNKEENLMNFLLFHSHTLVFVTDNSINKQIYLVSFDSSYEVCDIKKILFNEQIKKLSLYDNILAVESMNQEIVIYDIDICKAIISLTDSNMVSFNILYNNLLVLLDEDEVTKVNIYEIKPNFELITEQEINQVKGRKYISSYFGTGRIVLYSESSIDVFNYDKFNGINYMTSLDTLGKNLFMHYYENILVTKNMNDFTVYKFAPDLKYTDNHVNCEVKFDGMNICSNKENSITIFFKVSKKIHMSLNDTIIHQNYLDNTSIVQLHLNLNANENIHIDNINKNTKLCGVVVGKINEKLPCFLRGTMINTPVGKVPIETIKEGDIVINEFDEEVLVEKTKKWSSTNFTEGIIPYIIPENSLQMNYPTKDTYVSPFHAIKLPNGNFKRVNQINLPMIKKFQLHSNKLKYNDIILEEVTYYNFVLSNNSNFIANGMVVESLDKNNKI